MKKSSLLISTFSVFILVVVVVLSSCKKEEEYECSESNLGYGTFEACCTSSDCYYLYDGKKYPCDGTDCESAAEDLVEDMMDDSQKTICIDDYEMTRDELKNKILGIE